LDIPVDPDGAEPEYETILELIQAYPHLTAHRKKTPCASGRGIKKSGQQFLTGKEMWLVETFVKQERGGDPAVLNLDYCICWTVDLRLAVLMTPHHRS
jgi:hypothetical protein